MLEASIFRKRLLNVGRQPALQRVAHLLCEQLARREAVGINSTIIPLTQLDLADAVGLSIVHVNRTLQELRRLNILSKEGRAIKVLNRERLVCLASFDGHYLNMPQLLSDWQVKIERDSMPVEPSQPICSSWRKDRLTYCILPVRSPHQTPRPKGLHSAPSSKRIAECGGTKAGSRTGWGRTGLGL